MEAYETEDQQVEAIKKWWLENYKFVLLVAVLGVGGILGGQYYQQNKIMTGETASDNYNAVLNAVAQQQPQIVEDRSNLLQKDFSSSPYAVQATLLLAKNLAESGKKQQAIEKLQWIEKNTSDKSMQQIALIQRAQLLASNEQAQQALQLLEQSPEEGPFAAIKLETRGDILVVMGKQTEAKKAYDEAMGKYILLGASVDILRIKRNDLGN